MHRLLNTYTQRDLVEAARYSGLSRPIAAALRALANEGSRMSSRDLKIESLPSPRKKQRPSAKSGEKMALDALRSSPYFESTNAIMDFAKSIGLRIQRSPKEGKDRLARKVVRGIALLPEGRRAQILRELANGRSAQTQGWIEVIKTSRNE
jgi:hypothetical protein